MTEFRFGLKEGNDITAKKATAGTAARSQDEFFILSR